MNRISWPKLVFVFLISAFLLLISKLGYAQEQVIPGDDGEVCKFGFANTSGASSDANVEKRQLQARVNGEAFGAVTASAEFGVSFRPVVSFPADLTAFFSYNGRMRDLAAPDSFYRIEMTLFNEDTGAELDSVTIASQSAPPPTTIIFINHPFDAGTLTADLEAGTEYRVQMRLITEANGPLASVDFFSGNRSVSVSCLEIIPNLTDSDGDGIYDNWEVGGIDIDGGAVDLDLNALGKDFRGVSIQLDPQRKDILVEIDYFDCATAGGDCTAGDNHSHRPDPAALTTIVQSFAAAPVNNPNGSTGINLWIVLDEALPHQMACDLDAACFDVIKDSNLGPPPHLSDDAAQAARQLIFHYNLWIHAKAMGNGSSGESDGGCDGGNSRKWGDDFIVALGTFPDPSQNGTISQQAGTFMHELGHNLGLCHGGQEDINCKPNYLSVMNYTFQFRGIPLTPITGIFDYSRDVLPGSEELVETDLDETIGIQDGGLQTWYGPPININGIDENTDGDLTDDWSLGQGIGGIDWNVNGSIEPSVAIDINNMEISGCGSSSGETLLGFDDWSNLIYNFRNSEFFPAGHAPGADQELDHEEVAKIDAATWWHRSGSSPYEYRAKVVCGLQGDAEVLRLIRGLYGSTINILNGNSQPAEFLKQLVLTFPPFAQRPGDLLTIGLDNLPANRALKVDCDDIQARLFPDEGFPEGYIEGFITLWSNRSLDVIGVYTAASVDPDGHIIGGNSIDVEQVPERRRQFGADLAITKRAQPGNFASTTSVNYTIEVTNHGPAAVTNVIVQDTLKMVIGNLVTVLASEFAATHAGVWALGPVSNTSAKMTVTIPLLPAFETAKLEFAVVTSVDINKNQVRLEDSANVSSGQTDTNPVNNSVTITTSIAP